MAESLHSEATPYTLARHRKRIDTITLSAKLITQDVASAFLPASYMWAKQSGLPVIDSSNRLPALCCIAEEFVNLAHVRRTRRSWRHIFPRIRLLSCDGLRLHFMTQ